MLDFNIRRRPSTIFFVFVLNACFRAWKPTHFPRSEMKKYGENTRGEGIRDFWDKVCTNKLKIAASLAHTFPGRVYHSLPALFDPRSRIIFWCHMPMNNGRRNFPSILWWWWPFSAATILAGFFYNHHHHILQTRRLKEELEKKEEELTRLKSRSVATILRELVDLSSLGNAELTALRTSLYQKVEYISVEIAKRALGHEGRNHQATLTCVVCRDNHKTHTFLPCGHRCVCASCANQILHRTRQCPICRTRCTGAVQVYV
jgi:hypothetical protein